MGSRAMGRRFRAGLGAWRSGGRSRGWRWAIALLLALLLLRFLPYLAPIRAADLAQDDRAVEFRDRHGLPLGTLLTRDQNHTAVVPLDQVSPHFLAAIIAAEDRRFYQHGGVDGWAVGRAIAEALQSRRVVSGASTITMQLARLLEPTPRTLTGKAQEVWQAWRLAAGMSRQEILQAYVNRLPMGSNIYGVEAAARVYFGVAARDLTLAQASLLAGLPNDPTDLNPYDRWDALKQRQRYVLDRLVQDGKLDPQQADRVFAEAVTLQPRSQGIVAAPHFLFWQASQLPPDHAAQVRTSLDLPLQQFVEAQVRQTIQGLQRQNVHQAAALVLDNATGEVLAYVGSTDYFADGDRGRNDGVQALRQPGSTLKPFVYELALETRAIRPNTILPDVPTHYAIPGARLYSPRDYSDRFLGPVRVRVALANSLNIPAVRVLEKVGVAAFLQRLRDLGFQHLQQSPEFYGLGLALGSGEVSLWELAHAYHQMWVQAAGAGRDALTAATPPRPASTLMPQPAIWSLLVDMLGDRHARARSFGVDSVLSLPFPAAVKTGTSSDFRDTWTVGFTQDYTVATWVGNFDGSPMQQVSGVTGAAPLWSRILLHLQEGQEPGPLPAPLDLVPRPICALSGMRPNAACPTVVQEYLFPQDLPDYERQPDTVVVAGEGDRGYRLNLPPEYNEWLAQQPQPALTPGSLRILAPRNGDYYVAAPSGSGATPQRLELKLSNPHPQAVEWRLNGKVLAATSDASVFWPLQPGDWTLQVTSGTQSDQVRFQVGTAAVEPTRRGFSLKE